MEDRAIELFGEIEVDLTLDGMLTAADRVEICHNAYVTAVNEAADLRNRLHSLEAQVATLTAAARKAEAYLDATACQQPASGMAAEIRSELLAALEKSK